MASIFDLMGMAMIPCSVAQEKATEEAKKQVASKLVATHANAKQAARKIVLIAGRPSHPSRMHEFNAGVQLLAKCLKDVTAAKAEFVLNGWPKDESIFEDASAVIFYMDGSKGHEAVQEDGRRLKLIDQWVQKGVGIGCMHHGAEIIPDQAGAQFKRWIGGYYENMFSCNPIMTTGQTTTFAKSY